MNLKKKSTYWLTFFGCLAIFLIRGYSRLKYAEVWAEDGVPFLKDSLAEGFASLSIPYAGSYHPFQRLVVIVLQKTTPVHLWAKAFCLSNYFIFSLVAATFTKDALSWIIPSKTARIAMAFLFCGLQGTPEMIGNASNLNWVMFAWLALLGLREPKEKIAFWELLTATITVATLGTSLFLAPLFVWRLWYCQSSEAPLSEKRKTFYILSLIFLLNAWLVILRLSTSNHYGADSPDKLTLQQLIEMGPRSYMKSLFRSALYQPWLGEKLTTLLIDSGGSPKSLFRLLDNIFRISSILGLLFWLRKRFKEPRALALTSFLFGISFWVVLVWFARPGSIGVIFQGGYSQGRYAFPLSFAALVFWMGLFHAKKLFAKVPTSVLSLLFLILGFFYSWQEPFYPAYRIGNTPETTEWEKGASSLKSSIENGCPKEVRIPIAPGKDWHFTYLSPKPDSLCSIRDYDGRQFKQPE